MLLEVQICTFGIEGLRRTSQMELPEIENVIYTICFQNYDSEAVNFKPFSNRTDVRILEHCSTGLSVNRNFGIENAIGDIILIADDDLRFDIEGLNTVKTVFQENSDLSFATFKHCGADNKVFPHHEFDFSEKEPSGYYLTSFELAIKKSSLPKDIRFSPTLGIGSAMYGAGEENVFLHRLRRKDLKGRFFPVVIAFHDGITTGNRKPTKSFLRSQGVWLWIRYGWMEGFIRIILDILRRKSPYIKNAYYLFRGFFKAHLLFYRDGRDR